MSYSSGIPRRTAKQVIVDHTHHALRKVENGGPFGQHLITQLKVFQSVAKEMKWTELERRIASAIEKSARGPLPVAEKPPEPEQTLDTSSKASDDQTN